MALLLRRSIEALGRAVLGMALSRFAKDTERTDAADGGGPSIPGGGGIIGAAKRVIRGASQLLATKVQRHSQGEFKRLGISLREAEPSIADMVDGWRASNVERVGSLLEHERDELSDILSKGANKSVEALRQDIEERLDVSRGKADFLARDQVLTLNAQITKARHEAAGITEYIWTTSRDERVRATHEELDGETFSWDDPPVTNEAGDHNHPGEDYGCRCVAVPILPELEDDD